MKQCEHFVTSEGNSRKNTMKCTEFLIISKLQLSQNRQTRYQRRARKSQGNVLLKTKYFEGDLELWQMHENPEGEHLTFIP